MARRSSLATLGPGQFVGEMALLDNEPRSASVVTQLPTTAYRIRPRRLRAPPRGVPVDRTQAVARAVDAPAASERPDGVAGDARRDREAGPVLHQPRAPARAGAGQRLGGGATPHAPGTSRPRSGPRARP
ncbi:MAG: cyclic nucleotide-binding domain-containing protein [Thermoanaerobaculaceae bacterium]